MFITITLTRTFIILRSRNWINIWIGLEINLISFIPIISETKNPFLSEGIIIYFLIQRIASAIIIISIIIRKLIFININKNYNIYIIIIRIMIKIGIPPFHLWFPEIMNKIKWNICFILRTWQKIGPLYILRKIMENRKTTIIIITITAIVGAINGINQTSTRKIMRYSSINHLRWLIILILSFKETWIIYITIYILLIIITCNIIFKYNILFINQIKTFSTNNIDKTIIITTILRLGGIPPFLGFLPKILTIQIIININEITIIFLIIISTLITLSYYLKIRRSTNLLLTNSQKWINLPKNIENIFMYIIIINILFPSIILLIFF